MLGCIARFMNSSTIVICVAAGALALPKVFGDIFGFRRVHRLLKKYPNAEQTSLFVPSSSVRRPWRVWPEVGSKIEADMKKQGWTFLRCSRVHDSHVTLSGVTLHFIRTDGFKTRHAA
jgi:hypothetical protein